MNVYFIWNTKYFFNTVSKNQDQLIKFRSNRFSSIN